MCLPRDSFRRTGLVCSLFLCQNDPSQGQAQQVAHMLRNVSVYENLPTGTSHWPIIAQNVFANLTGTIWQNNLLNVIEIQKK